MRARLALRHHRPTHGPTTEEIRLVVEQSIDRTKPAPPRGRPRLSEQRLSMRPSPDE